MKEQNYDEFLELKINKENNFASANPPETFKSKLHKY